MGNSKWDCGEVFEKLQDYLDRELTPDEMEAVKVHLGLCGPCAEEYVYEGSVLRHIRRCMKDIEVPADLEQICFEKIKDGS